MMELDVFDRQGNSAGKISFDESCLGEFVNRQLLHRALVMYQANRRQGTVKTKNVRETTGYSGKPFKQKGTGNARMGKRRRFGSVHGATAFGPRPRDFRQYMPRTARQLALKSALLGKFRDLEVKVVTELSLSAPKTKDVAGVLTKMQVINNCLVIVPAYDENLLKSIRNLPKAELSVLGDLNALSVMLKKQLVFTKAAIEALPAMMKGEVEAPAEA